MEPEIEKALNKLETQLEDTKKRLTIIEQAAAITAASQALTKRWAMAFGGIVIAWMGVTSFLQIPNAISTSTVGKAEMEAKAALQSVKDSASAAKTDAEALHLVASKIPEYAHVIQTGQVPIKVGQRSFQVTFPKPFTKKPHVNVHFTSVIQGINEKGNTGFTVSASDIDEKGFKGTVSFLYPSNATANVEWIAFGE